MDPLQIGATIFVEFIPFLFALCFHEYAHGQVALWYGDRTAKTAGRLTLNPIAHADLMGTLIIPMLAIFMPGAPLFGWAKPVPVDERNLKHPVQDMFWIALAGPLSNLLLAVFGAFALVLMTKIQMSETNFQAGFQFLQAFLYVNLFLAFFNLIPVHPLDGGKILARYLPRSANRWLEDNQDTLNWILIGGFVLLYVIGGLDFLAAPVIWIGHVLVAVAQAIV